MLKLWKPQEWNDFCFLLENAQYDLILNNEKVLSGHLKESSRSEFQNISRLVLMSRGLTGYQSFYGAITDLQIWKRLLSNKEITDFNDFKMRNFYETVDFCNDVLNSRIVVGRNEEILRAMGEEIKACEGLELFYSGYIDVGNQQYLDFYDKHPMNLRKVDIIL